MTPYTSARPLLSDTKIDDPLPARSIYRSKQGRQRIFELHQKSLDDLKFNVRHQIVPTSFGETFLSIAGNADAPPILVLPGMSIAGPMMLNFFDYLRPHHLLIAPDFIGQPGRSQDVPFPHKKHAYGQWALDILDQMEIKRAGLASASFGGAAALALTAMAPERVGKQVLVVPAGLTPKLPFFKLYAGLAVNWLTYRWWPFHRQQATSYKWLERIAKPLSRSLTPDNLVYFDAVVRHTAFWRHRPAGPFFKDDFAKNVTPTFAIFAQKDFVFPHRPTLINAKQSLPMAEMEILKDSAHMPSDTDMAPLHAQISAYFGGSI